MATKSATMTEGRRAEEALSESVDGNKPKLYVEK